MRNVRLRSRANAVFVIAALMVALSGAESRAQTPPPYTYRPAQELDQLVSGIALYPDPLLSQVLAVATFPDEISDAAQWADQHHYLTDNGLASAIEDDHLPWDPSVQALLPFPSVLAMMAGKMPWTTELGDTFLAQREDVMDAIQRMRQRARNYGYLQSNSEITVSRPPFIQILLVNPTFVVVPFYDSVIAFAQPQAGLVVGGVMVFGFVVNIGHAFRPWGWEVSRFYWSQHDVFTHRPAPRWEPKDRVEKHALVPRSPREREEGQMGRPLIEEHGERGERLS